MRRKIIAAVISALAMVAPTQAMAQRADRTDRADRSEFRRRTTTPPESRPAPVPIILTTGVEEALLTGRIQKKTKPLLTLSIGSPMLFDSNPESDPAGSVNAATGTPSVALSLAVPSFVGAWDLKVAGGTDADVYSRNPDDLDETRINGQVSLSRTLSSGKLSFGFKEKVAYLGFGYGRFNYAMERYFVSFAPKTSDKIAITLVLEYRASAQSAQRRVFGSGDVQWTVLDNKSFSVVLDQEFDLSAFRKGTNSGRLDLLSQSSISLAPKIGLPSNVNFSIGAFFFHRFSNRDTKRFSEFQFGPALTIDFPKR